MQQTIPVNDAVIDSYVGSVASSGPFQVDFPFFSYNDVIVSLTPDGSGTPTILVRGPDYTLVGVATEDGSFSSGTVTLVLPVTNTTIRRYRDTPVERLSNFPLQGFFSRLALNAELNKITVWMQENDTLFSTLNQRALVVPEDGTNTIADVIGDRAGKVLAWDNNGNLIHSSKYLVDIESGAGGGSSPATVYIGATPPVVSAPGQFWFYSEDVSGGGQLYMSYQDANSTQWVPTSPLSGTGGNDPLPVYSGSGPPTFAAVKGALYSNTTATTATTRVYVNTDGATAWTNLVAGA
jgi:hypothetical protein